MLKKISKALIIIPIYIFFLVEGFWGGYTNGKYSDPWDKVKQWIIN